MLSKETVRHKEEEIRELVRSLPNEKRKAFFEIADPKLKDPDTYATLNYMFIAGLHHFYLGRWIHGSINLGIFLLGVVSFFMGHRGMGLLCILGITAAELYSLFFSQVIVQDHNNEVMIQILKTVAPSLLTIE
jgi:TM2 domain-containing membrane protein YozV